MHKMYDIDTSSSDACNSLIGLATRRLVNLLLESPTNTVNLNEAADILNVQKRRLNDITLVLEGAGLVDRPKKNHIHWFLSDVDYLANKESEIDSLLATALLGLMKLKKDSKFAYVTRKDLDIAYSDKTVMALKVPPNTTMKVPEDMPENGIKLYFQSEDGPIKLYIDDN